MKSQYRNMHSITRYRAVSLKCLPFFAKKLPKIDEFPIGRGMHEKTDKFVKTFTNNKPGL